MRLVLAWRWVLPRGRTARQSSPFLQSPSPFLYLFSSLRRFHVDIGGHLRHNQNARKTSLGGSATMSKTTHTCDTDNPQRPCCWMARNAELDSMRTPEAIAKQKAAQAAHDAKIDGFAIRGCD
jgi:hypothetical protein